jgi:MYXO-CTERM domain-containing protein
MGVFFSNPGSYTNGSVAYPGPGSPQTLPAPAGSTQFDYSSTTYATTSALQTAYPFGTYTVSAGGGSEPSATAVIPYAQDYFTSTIPYVTNFSSLNGLNTTVNFTFNYNSFLPNSSCPAACDSAYGLTFFTIYDFNTGLPVFSDNFLDPSTTSSLILAGTLLPGTDYVYELDFSNRLEGYDFNNSTFTTQGFDLRTDGSFTTAETPLPPAWPLMMSGLAGLVFVRRRGMKKNAAAHAAA